MKENKEEIKKSIERFKYELRESNCDYPIAFSKNKGKQKILKRQPKIK